MCAYLHLCLAPSPRPMSSTSLIRMIPLACVCVCVYSLLMPSFFLQAQCPQTGLLNNLWGRDRIDQANTTGDGKYETPGCNCGTGVNIFVLDTGVRLSHLDFADREGISKDFDVGILDEDEIKNSLRKIKETRHILKHGKDSKYRAVSFNDETRLKRGASKCTNASLLVPQ